MSLMTDQHDSIAYSLFLACTLIFLFFEQSLVVLGFLTAYGIFFGVLAGVIFILCAFSYVHLRGPTRERIIIVSFIAGAINLLVTACYIGVFPSLYYEQVAFELFMIASIVMTVSLPLFLGIHLANGRDRRSARFGYALIVIAIALIAVYFASGLVVRSYHIDDEMYISMLSMVNLLAHGTNPYAHSFAAQLYSNSSIGMTFTTNNRISGTLEYPALYMLAEAPFVLLARLNTFSSLEHVVSGAQIAVFLAFLLVVIGFSIETRMRKELIGLVLIVGFMVVLMSSINEILMLALLILAYREAGNKYSWLLLGLCVSMQELLWIPALLILAYTFRNYGLKKGFSDIVGAASVFLLINGYFILQGPSVFFSSIFSTTRGLDLPFGSSPFGPFILLNYHTLLGLSSAIFYIAIMLMVVASLYFNDKRLVGLFSMIPFMFAFRSLESYYSFFALFLFVTLLMKKPVLEKRPQLGLRHKAVLAALTCLLIAGLVIATHSSHVDYVKGLDLSISNQSALHATSSNSIEYFGTLHYNGTGTAYLMFFGYSSAFGIQKIGLYNQSLIGSAVRCASGNVTCMVNVNRLELNGSDHTIHIAADIPYSLADGNNGIRIAIYTGNYFYLGNEINYN